MHELGVVFTIAKHVEDIAKDNRVTKVHSVTLEIGGVSTIIPYYLTDCWNWNANKSDLLRGCELIIETIDAVTYCEACKKEYPTVTYGKTCPHCQSENTYLVRGNEVTITEICEE